MDRLKAMFKESFDIWVKMRWLNEINRAVTRYDRVLRRSHKLISKVRRERHVMNELLKEYNKRYNTNL